MHYSEYHRHIREHNRDMRKAHETRSITVDQLDRIGEAIGYARRYIRLSGYVIVIAFMAGMALGLLIGAVVL